MIRLFTAIEIPEYLRLRLAALTGGVPGARWVRPENMHLTLVFIGEVDGDKAADIDAALRTIRMQAFPLALQGIGTFGDRKPRALWVGVQPNEPLQRLQGKVETALKRAGCALENRKFTPHVTLARLRNGAPAHKLAQFVHGHNLFASEAFTADRFVLFSSDLSHEGSHYHVACTYALEHHAAVPAGPV